MRSTAYTVMYVGYETHMAGKWHVGYSKIEQTPVGRGFDEFKGCLQGVKNFFTHDVNITGNPFQGGFALTCSCDDDPSTANFTADYRQNGSFADP